MFAWLWLFVPLLWLVAFLFRGKRRRYGLLKPYASIDLRVPGTQTQATGTTEACSFFLVPGTRWEGEDYPPTLLPGSSSTGPGSYIYGTVVVGGNGGQRDNAV